MQDRNIDSSAIFKILWRIGYISKSKPSPNALSISWLTSPATMPKINGTVLLYPNLAPEAVKSMLLGPGVTVIIRAKIKRGIKYFP